MSCLYAGNSISAITTVLDCQRFNSHFVLLDVNQDPQKTKRCNYNWKDRKPTREEVLRHCHGGGLVGIVPASVLCGVADYDKPDTQEGFLKIRKELRCRVFTRSKTGIAKHHMWFKLDARDLLRFKGNKQLYFGDWRCGNGYVVLWNPNTAWSSYVCSDEVEEYEPLKQLLTYGKKISRGRGTAHNKMINQLGREQKITGSTVQSERAALASNIPKEEVDAAANWIKQNSPSNKTKTLKDASSLEHLEFVLDDMQLKPEYIRRSNIFQINGEVWDDNRLAELRCRIEKEYSSMHDNGSGEPSLRRLEWRDHKWHQMLKAICYKNESDPIKEYFESLPEPSESVDQCWKLLGRFLVDTAAVEDTDLNNWGSSLAWLGVVQRTYFNGCPIKKYPIWVGDTDWGKSVAVTHMFKKELRELFVHNDVDFLVSKRDLCYEVMGKALIEMGEMSTVTRTDAQKLKNWMASGSFKGRLLFEKTPRTIDFTHYMIGTANTTRPFLPAEKIAAGRFIPVEFRKGFFAEDWMKENRDKYWAMAVKVVKAANSAEFLTTVPEKLRHQQEHEMNKYRYNPSPDVTDLIEVFLENLHSCETSANWNGRVWSGKTKTFDQKLRYIELCGMIFGDRKPKNDNLIVGALYDLGFKQDGSRRWDVPPPP